MDPAYEHIETWKSLLRVETRPLLRAVMEASVASPALIRRLRRTWPPALVHAAIELTAARSKAEGKLDHAETIVADVQGVEQASSALVAGHKARRFADLAPARIHDLCCGIGGDAMHLARVAPVIGIDCDPLRTWMAAHNAGCQTVVADVETLDLTGAVMHLDPSRRDDGGRRRWRYQDYRPGPESIARLLAANTDAAVKLGPGVEFAALPFRDAAEIEIINEHGTLTQAVLWTGRLARQPGRRTATRLPQAVSFTGTPVPIPLSAADRFLFDVDPSIERADLIGALAQELDVAALHPKSGLLTAAETLESPWLTGYELLADLPWRSRKVRTWLHAHDAGEVIVRTRGRAVDPDAIQKQLRGEGGTRYIVFIQRFDAAVRALVCRRI